MPVVLHEMRPVRGTEAHKTDGLAELVCSNSFRSDDWRDQRRRPAARGDAARGLADHARGRPAQAARRRRPGRRSRRLLGRGDAQPCRAPARHDRARRGRRPAAAEWDSVIIATGPLTSPALVQGDPRAHRAKLSSPSSTPSRRSCISTRSMRASPGASRATTRRAPAAPAPTTSTARWRRREYEAFIDALLAAEKTSFKEWEASTPYFDGCLPIEVMAERGRETLRFGPMKPVGLTNPHTGERPYAVVQLRQDNALGTLWNMVGFQTKLKHGEQVRVLRHHPGPRQCRVRAARAACIATPSSIRPKLLDGRLRLKADAAPALCGADHGRARATSRAPPSACWRARWRRPSGWAVALVAAAGDDGASARCSPTSPAATSRTTAREARARSSR